MVLHRLPVEILSDTLAFLDALSLCRFEATFTRAVSAVYDEKHWKPLYRTRDLASVAAAAAAAAPSKPANEPPDSPRNFKALVREAFVRERGAIVIELGASMHRIGLAYHATPRMISRAIFDLDFEDLLVPSNSVSEIDAVEALVRALPSLVGGILRDPSILLVIPTTATRHALALLAKRLLHQGCRRVRFERAPVCACIAHGVATGIVVDIGQIRTRVTPVVWGCVPAHLEGVPEVHAVESGMLSFLAGQALSSRLKSLLGFPVDDDTLEQVGLILHGSLVNAIILFTCKFCSMFEIESINPDIPAVLRMARI
jgi:hypothetical protein